MTFHHPENVTRILCLALELSEGEGQEKGKDSKRKWSDRNLPLFARIKKCELSFCYLSINNAKIQRVKVPNSWKIDGKTCIATCNV